MNTPQASWMTRLFAAGRLKEQQARLQAEAALASLQSRLAEVEAELKVRTDIMNVTSIVSEADKKGDILSINEKFIEVSKYSRSELIGQPHNTTRHPDMAKDVFKQMWSTIGRGQLFRGIIKNRAKDGTPYYVDAVIAPILGENGKPMKYLGVRYDITASEIERQNARGILGAIDAAYAYIEFDLAGHVLTANRNFLAPVCGTRQQQIGNVGTGNQQHKSHRRLGIAVVHQRHLRARGLSQGVGRVGDQLQIDRLIVLAPIVVNRCDGDRNLRLPGRNQDLIAAGHIIRLMHRAPSEPIIHPQSLSQGTRPSDRENPGIIPFRRFSVRRAHRHHRKFIVTQSQNRPPGIADVVNRTVPHRDLDRLVAEHHVNQLEAAPDDAAVAEGAAQRLGGGAGGHVEVLGPALEVEVAHAAADQVGLEAPGDQLADDLERVWIHVSEGDGASGACFAVGHANATLL